MKTELAVALDFPTREQAEDFLARLKNLSAADQKRVVLKVGLELFLATGADWVRSLIANGYRVFLDLKFHDIPNTVVGAALQAGRMGADFFTLHLSGGGPMMQKVKAALDQAVSEKEFAKRPRVLGVSVLTSFSEKDFAAVYSGKGVSDAVRDWVSLGQASGVDGIVCSPHEVAQVKSQFPSLFTVVPGIRPSGSDAGDQARVMTPKDASKAGADLIVVGRPITQAKDPVAVIQSILGEL
ncbi:MAG: orotidine-5'-phosphate decarboxylase [Bdellovibrionales bacterium]|nr:orotidine-5'-phosphate decarboxylase [Bdellovibrionales bacterium]